MLGPALRVVVDPDAVHVDERIRRQVEAADARGSRSASRCPTLPLTRVNWTPGVRPLSRSCMLLTATVWATSDALHRRDRVADRAPLGAARRPGDDDLVEPERLLGEREVLHRGLRRRSP